MTTSAMPPRLFFGNARSTSMDSLIHARNTQASDIASGFWGDDAQWLLGTIIPPFQRPVVWEQERMAAFIESAWLGLHLGNFVYNDLSQDPNVSTWRDDQGLERFHHTDRWLIDGQQRLTAIDRYLGDEFAVAGKFWSELGPRDQRRFAQIPFGSTTLAMTSEHDMRILYDKMNFGGVAHTADQRATPEGDSNFETQAYRGR